MEVTITKHPTQNGPSPEFIGEVVWNGGYGGGSEDEFPGSSISLFSDELEVGVWYPVEDFESHLNDNSVEYSINTEITVPVLTPRGEAKATIQIPQDVAVKMLITSVMSMVKAVHKEGNLWIRVI